MEFKWTFSHEEPMSVLAYLRTLDLPRRFITRLKFEGGDIQVNGQSVTVRKTLQAGDEIRLQAPIEYGHETVPPSFEPIDVVYEDRDILVVNKPMDVVSIPSRRDPDTSMANRIKGYYVSQGYQDQVIHIVTRLDRDTTGLMMIAKHRLAHAWMDRQIQEGHLQKFYYAISHKTDWDEHNLIDAPIARTDDSIINRRVHESGQSAQTEYWLQEQFEDSCLLKLQLHTGRTHQIRVHLTHLGGPLVGDDLYGGRLEAPLTRQALHCGELIFYQPFSKERIHLTLPLADDMLEWINIRRQK